MGTSNPGGSGTSPLSGNPSSQAKAKAALNTVLEHPFWGQFPKALSNGFDRVEQFFEKAEFDEALADRVTHALRLVAERGGFGAPEEAFLNAARVEFSEKRGFWATTIDFVQAVAGTVDPDDKKTPQHVRDHLDLARYIYIAARDKPEFLDLLNVSLYKDLDPSVCNNPNLDKLLDDLVKNGCVHVSHKDVIKTLLSPLRRNWTADRCDGANKAFAITKYFRDYDLAKLRSSVVGSRQEFPKVAQKILPIARGLSSAYSEASVLRFELICYIMHTTCLGVHA